MTTPDPIDHLAALLEKATPGEWEYDAGEVGVDRELDPTGIPATTMIVEDTLGDVEKCPVGENNGEFIAAAHNLMPRILDVMRAGRGVVDGVKNRGYFMDLPGDMVDDLNALANALDALQEGTP